MKTGGCGCGCACFLLLQMCAVCMYDCLDELNMDTVTELHSWTPAHCSQPPVCLKGIIRVGSFAKIL